MEEETELWLDTFEGSIAFQVLEKLSPPPPVIVTLFFVVLYSKACAC
jgi:hypothetical protein